MTDEHHHQYFCSEHGANCKALEYLDRNQRDILQALHDKTTELKDARNSIKQDMEKMEAAIKENYVHKNEFEPVKKLVYGMAALILLDAIRRLFMP